MNERITVKEWQIEGEKVKLTFSDGTNTYVKKADFDRYFGAIVSADKDDVVRDFAIEE